MYTRRRWGNQAEIHRLFALVEQVVNKLHEERQRTQPGVGQRVEVDNSFGNCEIPALGKDIPDLVDVLQETAGGPELYIEHLTLVGPCPTDNKRGKMVSLRG